jgi:hypothetical protein
MAQCAHVHAQCKGGRRRAGGQQGSRAAEQEDRRGGEECAGSRQVPRAKAQEEVAYRFTSPPSWAIFTSTWTLPSMAPKPPHAATHASEVKHTHTTPREITTAAQQHMATSRRRAHLLAHHSTNTAGCTHLPCHRHICEGRTQRPRWVTARKPPSHSWCPCRLRVFPAAACVCSAQRTSP